MADVIRRTYLYDYYGELLTEHQRKIYSMASLYDMTYTEIAESEGISRQAVHELIKKCDRTLEQYESKLHLIECYKNFTAKRDVLLDTIDRLIAASDKEHIGIYKDLRDKASDIVFDAEDKIAGE